MGGSWKDGDRIRGRFTERPGTITKVTPAGVYVHFDGDDHEYPVMLHSALHIVPIDRPSVLREVGEELERARAKFPGKQNSPHEGWAVLQEEVDELWDDVKGDAPRAQMRKEAVQIAAMAVRFIEDLCDPSAESSGKDPT